MNDDNVYNKWDDKHIIESKCEQFFEINELFECK